MRDFDLFQLDDSRPSTIKIEQVCILKAEQRQGSLGIPGVRYYKIYTNYRQVRSFGSAEALDTRSEKYVFRRYSDFEVLHNELVDQYLGRFVPSIPGKDARDSISDNNSAFVIERTKLL